jgi:hypothetical protein
VCRSESAITRAGCALGLPRSRPVPARDAIFHLEGRTHCAAPIIEVANTVYVIEGDVKCAPQAGAELIKGELSEDHSAVWAEDLSTRKQLGNELLVKGSTALNRGTLFLLGEGVAKFSKQKLEEISPQ